MNRFTLKGQLLLLLCLLSFTTVYAQGGYIIQSVPTTCPDKTITVAVMTDTWTNVSSTQFTLEWDPSQLNYVNHIVPSAALSDFLFGDLTSQGKLTSTWFDANTTGISIEDELAILMTFEVIGAEGDTSGVKMTSGAAVIEFTYFDTLQVDNFEYTPINTDAQILIQSPIAGSPDVQNSIDDNPNGAVTITPTFGTAPYSVMWDNGISGNSIDNLMPGDYHCTVSDGAGCSSENGPFVVASITNTNEIESLNSFLLSPNPASEFVTVNVAFTQNENTRVRIIDITGQVLYQSKNEGTAFSLDIPVAEFANGTYFVEIATTDGTAVERMVVAK